MIKNEKINMENDAMLQKNQGGKKGRTLKELNLMDDFLFDVATEDLETSLKINWGPLYNWDNYYPHSHAFFIQDFDYVESCFKAVVNGHMSREELQTALSPSVLSIERYYSQVKADKEYTESIIEEKLRTFIEGIDTNAIIRNILYLSVPYLKDFLIGFLTLDKDA